jgi:hypothetical protein
VGCTDGRVEALGVG